MSLEIRRASTVDAGSSQTIRVSRAHYWRFTRRRGRSNQVAARYTIRNERERDALRQQDAVNAALLFV